MKSTTADQSVIFGKITACEVNEVNALVRTPNKEHVRGEAVRATHLMIPQAEGELPAQENMLSTYTSSAAALGQLKADDFPQIQMLEAK